MEHSSQGRLDGLASSDSPEKPGDYVCLCSDDPVDSGSPVRFDSLRAGSLFELDKSPCSGNSASSRSFGYSAEEVAPPVQTSQCSAAARPPSHRARSRCPVNPGDTVVG